MKKNEQLIKVYGERNTGTNYLAELIDLNINASQLPGTVPALLMRLQNKLPGSELIRDIYFRLTFYSNLGWKHSAVKKPDNLCKYNICRQNIYFITLSKNPYSWLLSLYNRPYHQYYKSKPSFKDFITSPWITLGRDNVPGTLKSPVELWNIKNRSYINLSNKFRVVHLKYEDLLDNPEEVILQILERFSLKQKQSKFINNERSTKDSNKTFKYYQDYYLLEKWKEKISAAEIDLINERLDFSTIDFFEYSIL